MVRSGWLSQQWIFSMVLSFFSSSSTTNPGRKWVMSSYLAMTPTMVSHFFRHADHLFLDESLSHNDLIPLVIGLTHAHFYCCIPIHVTLFAHLPSVKFSHNNLKTKADLTKDSIQFYTWKWHNSAAIGGCSCILSIMSKIRWYNVIQLAWMQGNSNSIEVIQIG